MRLASMRALKTTELEPVRSSEASDSRHCGTSVDVTGARNVVQKLLDAATSGQLASAWWDQISAG